MVFYLISKEGKRLFNFPYQEKELLNVELIAPVLKDAINTDFNFINIKRKIQKMNEGIIKIQKSKDKTSSPTYKIIIDGEEYTFEYFSEIYSYLLKESQFLPELKLLIEKIERKFLKERIIIPFYEKENIKLIGNPLFDDLFIEINSKDFRLHTNKVDSSVYREVRIYFNLFEYKTFYI